MKKSKQEIYKQQINWRKTNPDRVKESNKKYSKNHPEKIREKAEKYRKKHREQIKNYMKKWRSLNKIKKNKYSKEERYRTKIKVFTHYSGNPPKCLLCGFNDIRSLVLDHVNNNGAEDRKKFKTPDCLLRYIKRSNYPKEFQILCANCNMIKEYIRRQKV